MAEDVKRGGCALFGDGDGVASRGLPNTTVGGAGRGGDGDSGGLGRGPRRRAAAMGDGRAMVLPCIMAGSGFGGCCCLGLGAFAWGLAVVVMVLATVFGVGCSRGCGLAESVGATAFKMKTGSGGWVERLGNGAAIRPRASREWAAGNALSCTTGC